jgi:hypothetical protein
LSNYYVIGFSSAVESNQIRFTNPSAVTDTIYIGVFGGGGAGGSVEGYDGGVAGGGGASAVFFSSFKLQDLFDNFQDNENFDGTIPINITLGQGGIPNTSGIQGGNGTDTIIEIYGETITSGGGKGGSTKGGYGGKVSGSIRGINSNFYPPLNIDGSYSCGGDGCLNNSGISGQSGVYIFTGAGAMTFCGGGGGSGFAQNDPNAVNIGASGGEGGGGNAGIFCLDPSGNKMTYGIGTYGSPCSGGGGGGAIALAVSTPPGTYIPGGYGGGGVVIMLIPYPSISTYPFNISGNADFVYENELYLVVLKDNTGSVTFTADIISNIALIGAGGSGGGGYSTTGSYCSGGSGGSCGDVVSFVVSIAKNTVIGSGSLTNTISIGANVSGGLGSQSPDTSASNGVDGQSTTLVLNSVTYTANGGKGGLAGVNGENVVIGGEGSVPANNGGMGIYSSYEPTSSANTSNSFTFFNASINGYSNFACSGAGGSDSLVSGGTTLVSGINGGYNGSNGSNAKSYGSGGCGGGGISNAGITQKGGNGGNGHQGVIIIAFNY